MISSDSDFFFFFLVTFSSDKVQKMKLIFAVLLCMAVFSSRGVSLDANGRVKNNSNRSENEKQKKMLVFR